MIENALSRHELILAAWGHSQVNSFAVRLPYVLCDHYLRFLLHYSLTLLHLRSRFPTHSSVR